MRAQGALLFVFLGGLLVGLSVGLYAGAGASEAAGLDGVREILASQEGLHVARGDAAWEGGPPSGLGAALSGQRALALASTGPGAPRDLYRVLVRLAPGGSVLHLDEVVNLTVTPHADEGDLVVSGHRAAYRSRAFGQVSCVVVLDLEGEDGRLERQRDRLMASISNRLETGDARGIGRTRLRFETPPSEVSLAWSGERLTLRWPGGEATWVPGPGLAGASAAALEERSPERLPKHPIHWAVDVARSYVGPEPIGWLEDKVFALADAARRARYRLGSGEAPAARRDPLDPYVAVPDGTWPPPPGLSAFEQPAEGEGRWAATGPDWLRHLPGAPPAFYETFVRADPERPYSRVRVLAMDGRQLAMGMEAGYEDPRPTTGAAGSGRIPRRPEILGNLVGAFNGAFKTDHGEYGMMVEGRVLLPPVQGAATVATFADGRVGFGNWDDDPASPSGMVSFRQNLHPLVDDGVVNPAGRRRWGWPRSGASLEAMQTQRSAICQLPGGHFGYVWSEDSNGETLGEGMRLAGCLYGIHLDMNHSHVGFHFLRIHDVSTPDEYAYLPWDRLMTLGSHRFVKASLKDFFYVTLRDPTPPPFPGATWSAEGLPQPDPSFVPALHRAELGRVRILSIRLDRAELTVRAGERELPTGTDEAPPWRIGEQDASRALLAFGGGLAAERPSGLVLGGRVYFAVQEGEPALVRDASGRIRIARWPVADAVDALQGRPLPRGEERAGPAGPDAAAVGLTEDDRLLYADGAPPDALADALAAGGATSTMLLSRGASAPAFLHLAGRGLRSGYDQASVFVLGRPAPPNVFRMDRDRAVLTSAR